MIDVLTEQNMFACRVAPEDIQVGDYIAALDEVQQFVLRACETEWGPGDRKPRMHVVSARLVENMPRVLRVRAVAIPFVLVEDGNGCSFLVTCRLAEFARLPEAMGRIALREVDRKRRAERAKRRERTEAQRAKRDQPGAGAEGSD